MAREKAAATRNADKRRDAASLATLVPGILAPALNQRGFATSAVMTQWREIVGARLADWTHPVEIRWPRRPGEVAAPAKAAPSPSRNRDDRTTRATLVIACPGAFALEVQMAEAGIIEAVNRRLGFGCIGAIRIVQGPKASAAPKPVMRTPDMALLARIEAGMVDIADEELRAALARFGAAIAAKG